MRRDVLDVLTNRPRDDRKSDQDIQQVRAHRATGRNERNVVAIASEIEDRLIEHGSKPLRREGRAEGRWILLDFGDLVVHVFHEEDRMYYSLERLWKDCPVVPIDLPVRETAE